MNLRRNLSDSGLLRRLLRVRQGIPTAAQDAPKALPWRTTEPDPDPDPGLRELSSKADAVRYGQARYGHGRTDTNCADCGIGNLAWYTDSSLWHEVMGRSRVSGEPGEQICPTCFVARAAAVGVVPAAWQLSAQWRTARHDGERYRPRHALHPAL